ncbi:MAG: carbonic anhydrase [Acidimicrobiales bacterium]
MALARLMAGNQRFVSGNLQDTGRDDIRRAQQAEGQTPYAIILGCSDSRVPPEVIFDEGIGDLFLVRVAGNTASVPILVGSIEYAVTTFGCSLLMVLGHGDCGAVKAAIDVVKKGTSLPGSLPAVVEPIIPAVRQVQNEPDAGLLQAATRQNALQTAAQLRTADSLITNVVNSGKLKIVAAEYQLRTGAVELL